MGGLWSHCRLSGNTSGKQEGEEIDLTLSRTPSVQPAVQAATSSRLDKTQAASLPPEKDTTAHQDGEESDISSQDMESEARSLQKNERSSKSGMTPRCKLALQKTHKEFIQELDVMTTMDHLFAKTILTLEDTQRIKASSTDHDRRRTLLEILPSRGQEAYDELCESLSSDQPWIKDTLDKTYENITEDELTKIEQSLDLHLGTSTAELQEVLKRNMEDRLNEYQTALEECVSNREGLLPYINQPCFVETQVCKSQSLNTFELIENSRPGDRLVIYGEAGMGKTTLLKQVARSWVKGYSSKLQEKFTYVFPIPLRFIGKSPLLHIICNELGLVPVNCLEELKKSVDLCEHRVLFLLDSYEELRRDVAKAKKSDIRDLITGRIFPRSTVVVTSRPGSKLKRAKHQTKAQLQDLPEKEVKTIIEHHFGGNKHAVDTVERSFPAMSYLQKPINLALFIFIITQNKHMALSYTQAELFSLVLQFIMLAFAKKKNLEEFEPQPGSYIANKDIPRDIRRLFSVIAMKCYEEFEQNDVIVHLEDAEELKEYLDFGLFTAGPDANTVLLPHRLFLEYFAAAYIAENPNAWTALFEEIKEESDSESPKLLSLVVRSMGLENLLRFVIALSPQPQLNQMCQQIGSLFVVERRKTNHDWGNYQLVNIEYYTELIRDCCDESGKRILATAVLDAPVRYMDRTHIDQGLRFDQGYSSHVILSYLDHKQGVTFLKKMHNLDLSVKDGKSTLSCTGGSKRLGITNADKFVVALLYHNGAILKAAELDISGEWNHHLDIPASLLTRMSGVRQLKLAFCILRKGLPDYMSDIGISTTPLHSSLYPTNDSLQKVDLFEVKGLEHCDVITSCQCQLQMLECGNVKASALKTWFPRVSELKLYSEPKGTKEFEPRDRARTSVLYDTDKEFMSWLSTVQTVRRLGLAPQNEGESLSLCHLLNILPEREQFEYLELHRYTLLLDMKETDDTVNQNNTLKGLWLEDCKGDVDLGQLLEVCSRHCRHLKEIFLMDCQLVFDDEKIDTLKQLPGLRRCTLHRSTVLTQKGEMLNWLEVRQHLRRLLPSVEIVIVAYGLEDIARKGNCQMSDDK